MWKDSYREGETIKDGKDFDKDLYKDWKENKLDPRFPLWTWPCPRLDKYIINENSKEGTMIASDANVKVTKKEYDIRNPKTGRYIKLIHNVAGDKFSIKPVNGREGFNFIDGSDKSIEMWEEVIELLTNAVRFIKTNMVWKPAENHTPKDDTVDALHLAMSNINSEKAKKARMITTAQFEEFKKRIGLEEDNKKNIKNFLSELLKVELGHLEEEVKKDDTGI